MTKKLFILMLLCVFALTSGAHTQDITPSSEKDVCDSMHIVLLGDSNTWLGGDDCTSKRG